jgi:hypothetical protein
MMTKCEKGKHNTHTIEEVRMRTVNWREDGHMDIGWDGRTARPFCTDVRISSTPQSVDRSQQQAA